MGQACSFFGMGLVIRLPLVPLFYGCRLYGASLLGWFGLMMITFLFRSRILVFVCLICLIKWLKRMNMEVKRDAGVEDLVYDGLSDVNCESVDNI